MKRLIFILRARWCSILDSIHTYIYIYILCTRNFLWLSLFPLFNFINWNASQYILHYRNTYFYIKNYHKLICVYDLFLDTSTKSLNYINTFNLIKYPKRTSNTHKKKGAQISLPTEKGTVRLFNCCCYFDNQAIPISLIARFVKTTRGR